MTRDRATYPGQRAANKSGVAPTPQGATGLPPDLMETYNAWPVRFSSKVRISNECWDWTASKTRYGYGRYGLGTRRSGWGTAHRWAYQSVHGEIPNGLVIDHLCRNPACVRPDHLEAVTQAENIRRGAAANGGSGWCRTGRHPWDEANILVEASGTRRCRPCRDERERAYRPLKGNAQKDRTHCPQGHPYDDANTQVKVDGSRSCRACAKERSRRNRCAKRQAS